MLRNSDVHRPATEPRPGQIYKSIMPRVLKAHLNVTSFIRVFPRSRVSVLPWCGRHGEQTHARGITYQPPSQQPAVSLTTRRHFVWFFSLDPEVLLCSTGLCSDSVCLGNCSVDTRVLPGDFLRGRISRPFNLATPSTSQLIRGPDCRRWNTPPPDGKTNWEGWSVAGLKQSDLTWQFRSLQLRLPDTLTATVFLGVQTWITFSAFQIPCTNKKC